MTIVEPAFRANHPGTDAVPPQLLDSADGIARVMGDRALYLRMLRRFRDDYQDGAPRIGAAVDSGDLRLAHRIAHTLKGAAGMISAPALYRLAGTLELELRSGQPVPRRPGMIDALGAALAELLPAIALLLGAAAVAPAPAPPALPPGQALVDRLAALLFNGDGAAVDVVEASAACLTAVLGEQAYRAVALAVHEFDFEGALEALSQAATAARTAAPR